MKNNCYQFCRVLDQRLAVNQHLGISIFSYFSCLFFWLFFLILILFYLFLPSSLLGVSSPSIAWNGVLIKVYLEPIKTRTVSKDTKGEPHSDLPYNDISRHKYGIVLLFLPRQFVISMLFNITLILCSDIVTCLNCDLF